MLMRLGAIVFALPGILLLVLYGLELSAITQCQELGLNYDVITQQCSPDEQPFNTFYMRNSLLVNSMMLLSVAGALALSWGMLVRGMAQQQRKH